LAAARDQAAEVSWLMTILSTLLLGKFGGIRALAALRETSPRAKSVASPCQIGEGAALVERADLKKRAAGQGGDKPGERGVGAMAPLRQPSLSCVF